MFMPKHAIDVMIKESDRQELEHWVSAYRTPHQVAQRCRLILAAAKGQQDKDIAQSMEINPKTVALGTTEEGTLFKLINICDWTPLS